MVVSIIKNDGDASRSVEAALADAIAERNHIDDVELPKVRAPVVELERKRERLTRFIESALPLLPPERQLAYRQTLPGNPAAHETGRGGPIHNNLVQLIRTSHDKEWTAPSAQEALSAKGIQAEQKQIHNLFGYLERDGMLRRVGRGRYLYMGVGIVTSDDLDSLYDDPTAGSPCDD